MAKIDHAKQILRYEIIGIVVLLLSITTLGDLGAVGQAMDDLCIQIAGNWHFILPIYMIWIALHVMIRRHRFRFTAFQIGLLLVILIMLTWGELTLQTQINTLYQGTKQPSLLSQTNLGIASLMQSLHGMLSGKDAAIPAMSAGGGLLGFVFFQGLDYLFSITGTYFALFGISLIAAVLITRKSLVATIEHGASWIEHYLDKIMQATRLHVERLRRQWQFRIEHKREARRSNIESDRTVDPIVVDDRQSPIVDTTAVQMNDSFVDDEVKDDFPYPNFDLDQQEHRPFEAFLVTSDLSMGHDSYEPTRQPTVTFEENEASITATFTHEELPKIEESVTKVQIQPEESKYEVDATKDMPKPYRLPDLRLLDTVRGRKGDANAVAADLAANVKKLSDTFASFGVSVKVLGYSRGPAVTRYEIQPAVGVKVSKIVSLTDDLALALAARDIRMEAPIPGKSAIGIEVPNSEIALVSFREVIETDVFTKASSKLAFALGKDIAGNVIIGDLAKMPHVLIAGATGSGKSVCVNGLIASILFRAHPDDVKFIMIDPKMVELGVYSDIPHLFSPVVTDARRAAAALRKVVAEMENRYDKFSKAKVRDLERYNLYAKEQGLPPLPLIVVIIDELADLMMVAPSDVEDAICRLAQMARAAGIHLVIATQRPSVDVITGLIKANVPSRIAFSVSSGVDSRTILDGTGAEKLLGRGDMLYLPVGASKPVRLQGAYLSETEVENLVDFIKNQQSAEYIEDFSLVEESTAHTDNLDPLFEEAVRWIVESQQASVSFLQRRLKIGYSRSARLVDSLEAMGIIGPFENSKPREVLMTKEEWQNRFSHSES